MKPMYVCDECGIGHSSNIKDELCAECGVGHRTEARFTRDDLVRAWKRGYAKADDIAGGQSNEPWPDAAEEFVDEMLREGEASPDPPRRTIEVMSRTFTLPWAKPTSHYDDDGMACEFMIDGHNFVVTDANEGAINTGRARWRVECLSCREVIHQGSTSASAQVRVHIEDKADPRD